MFEKIEKAVTYIKQFTEEEIDIGLILGSGLGILAEQIESEQIIPYESIPFFPRSTVEGHEGQFVIGRLFGKKVIAMQGRFHYYEGYSMEEVARPIRVMAELGVRTVIVTNAAGGINGDFQAGDFMLIADHLNLFGTNPLIGKNDERIGPRFPDMSEPYDQQLQKVALAAANALQLTLHKGVYAGVTGPMYETPSEVNMLGVLGADAVGMSTVPEVIAARHCGLRVLGISCISNMASGMSTKELSHEDVVTVTERVRSSFIGLIEQILKRL